MKKSLTFYAIFFTIILTSQAQEDGSSKFSVSVSGGSTIPVGSFGNKDIVNAAIYTPEDVQNRWIIGIDKSKSGFAEPGYFLNLELKYMLIQSFGLRLRTGYTFNNVYTEGISQFLTTNFGEQQFEHDSYHIYHIAPGLGYEKRVGNFIFGTGVYSGIAFTSSPYYQSTLLYIPIDPPLIWARDGDRQNLQSLLLGAAVNIDYVSSSKINWGIELSYQSANFDSSMRTRLIPGSSPNPEINDVLKTSNLNIGLRLQYNFLRTR